MNEASYNDQALKAYLLGTLPPVEAEHFDELSVTDGEFFAALNAAERDLIDAYVNDELAGPARERFEAHFLATPRHREKLKFARSFEMYAEMRPNDPVADVVKPLERTVETGLLSSIKNLFSIRLAFAAATLVIIAVGGWFLLRDRGANSNEIVRHDNPENQTPAPDKPGTEENSVIDNTTIPETAAERTNINGFANSGNRRNNTDEKERATPPQRNAIVALVLPPPVRGAGLKTLNLPEGATQVAVRLELESDEYKDFRVVLRDQATKSEAWSSGTVKASGNLGGRKIDLRIPARFLKPGVYSLNVSGISPQESREIVGDYLFRVVR